jgi:hypothetical protein
VTTPYLFWAAVFGTNYDLYSSMMPKQILLHPRFWQMMESIFFQLECPLLAYSVEKLTGCAAMKSFQT